MNNHNNLSQCVFVACSPDVSRKRLLPGSIPTLNLPKKSFERDPEETSSLRKSPKRQHSSGESSSSSTQSTIVYKNLDDFKAKVEKLKMVGWSRKVGENDYVIEHYDGKHALRLYSITIDSGLEFFVLVFA